MTGGEKVSAPASEDLGVGWAKRGAWLLSHHMEGIALRSVAVTIENRVVICRHRIKFGINARRAVIFVLLI